MLDKLSIGTVGLFIAAWVSLLLALVAGWVNNIVWLISESTLAPTGQFIVSIVGIVIPPVGAIHGLWVW